VKRTKPVVIEMIPYGLGKKYVTPAAITKSSPTLNEFMNQESDFNKVLIFLLGYLGNSLHIGVYLLWLAPRIFAS